MTHEERQKYKEYQKNYRKNMTGEQKQRYREDRKHKYHSMTDEERQKYKEYQKSYSKNMSDVQKQRYREAINKEKYYIEKKLNNKIIQHNDNDNYIKV